MFKSAPPKTDRRREWAALKKQHAKTLKDKKIEVEVGLGKALDGYQRQVDTVSQLTPTTLTPAALNAVAVSARVVKQHVATIRPRIKGLQAFMTYLDDLKEDATWWEKTAATYKQQPANNYERASQELKTAVAKMLEAEVEFKKMDALLVGAYTKTKTYDPPNSVTQWREKRQAWKPLLARLTAASKKPDANAKLLMETVKQTHDALFGFRTWALHLTGLHKQNLPPVADWQKVETLANAIMEKARDANRAIERSY